MSGELRACLLLNLEPALDLASGSAAMKSLAMADAVVAITPYRADDLLAVAHVLLPCGPFTETGGSLVNAEGRLQTFNGVVQAHGESRPAWKILRVLANRLDLKGFDFDSVADVRHEALGGLTETGALDPYLSNVLSGSVGRSVGQVSGGLERIADVPVYFSDAVVRRAASLQKTADAAAPRARIHPDTLSRLNIESGATVIVAQPGGEARVLAQADPTVSPDCVRLAAGHPLTANLASLSGSVELRIAAASPAPANAAVARS